MFWGKRYDAFISYSHKDAEVVKPLVELLSLNDRRVFWDQELAPGDQWNQVIRSSVRRSRIFVLFWCCDTGQSDYTAEEIAVALRLKKKIVPVKLCPAVMPQPLAQWQWIDLQKRVEHRCADLDHQIAHVRKAETPVTSRRFPSRKLAFASLACLVFTVAAMLYFDLLYRFGGSPRR
jgi:TIR domain